eukprot:TRINITY_DN3344_c0_g1_i2.p1 TRINITY_DN3344_c0_g1~~TRINITY_DN3344_c0_g1_i2.p1  ORF type:complete len:356 (+),score=78.89 TRINITY_DN3344_c0_g1_i2:183-1250(+)
MKILPLILVSACLFIALAEDRKRPPIQIVEPPKSSDFLNSQIVITRSENNVLIYFSRNNIIRTLLINTEVDTEAWECFKGVFDEVKNNEKLIIYAYGSTFEVYKTSGTGENSHAFINISPEKLSKIECLLNRRWPALFSASNYHYYKYNDSQPCVDVWRRIGGPDFFDWANPNTVCDKTNEVNFLLEDANNGAVRIEDGALKVERYYLSTGQVKYTTLKFADKTAYDAFINTAGLPLYRLNPQGAEIRIDYDPSVGLVVLAKNAAGEFKKVGGDARPAESLNTECGLAILQIVTQVDNRVYSIALQRVGGQWNISWENNGDKINKTNAFQASSTKGLQKCFSDADIQTLIGLTPY